MGFLLTGASAGLLIGPPLGGVLYEAWGHRAPFIVVTAAAALATLAAAALAPRMKQGPPQAKPTARTSVARELLARREVRICLALVIATEATLAMLEPIAPLRLNRLFGSGAAETGLILGAAVLAMGIAAPAAGALSDRFGRLPVARVGMIALSGSVLLFALSESFAAAVAAMVVIGVTAAFSQAPVLPLLAEGADRFGDRRAAATVASYLLFNVAYGGGLLIGPAVGSTSAAALGLVPAAIGATGICLLVGVLTMRKRRSSRPVDSVDAVKAR